MTTQHATATVRRRRSEGDVHIGSMGGDVRPAPGSGAPDGERKIAEIMNKVLAQVRRHVRERARAVTGDIDHDGECSTRPRTASTPPPRYCSPSPAGR